MHCKAKTQPHKAHKHIPKLIASFKQCQCTRSRLSLTCSRTAPTTFALSPAAIDSFVNVRPAPSPPSNTVTPFQLKWPNPTETKGLSSRHPAVPLDLIPAKAPRSPANHMMSHPPSKQQQMKAMTTTPHVPAQLKHSPMPKCVCPVKPSGQNCVHRKQHTNPKSDPSDHCRWARQLSTTKSSCEH